MRRTEYAKKAEWRVIMGWVDKEVFQEVDVTNAESFQTARKLSEKILVFLQKWYNYDYIRDSSDAFVDVPFAYDFNNNLIYGVAPILHINTPPTISIFSENLPDDLKIYDDYKIMGLGWLAMKQLSLDKIIVRCIKAGQASGIQYKSITFNQEKFKNIEKAVAQISHCIYQDIDYPAYNDLCINCLYRRMCRF